LVRHIAVLERQQRPVLGLLQHDCNDRIIFLVAEFAGAPRLDDAFAGDQFKIAAADIAVSCRDLGASSDIVASPPVISEWPILSSQAW
jgi:hypothetical protein